VAKQGNTGEKWPLNFAEEYLSCSSGSFTCHKSTTWDRRLYFPSEGRRATDLIIWDTSFFLMGSCRGLLSAVLCSIVFALFEKLS
jgi:hypothetical protein